MAHNPDIDRYFRPPTDAELAMRFAQETLKGYRESAAGKATIKTSARVEREINTIAEMIEEKAIKRVNCVPPSPTGSASPGS